MSFGSFGSGPGPNQKLTPEYLARQLPVFQERVPTSPKLQLKFPTNAPANLPSPPLLPGEVIQIQQHRVACTDMFSEPAVGAFYITNYRVIFYGNLISDPESMDALLEANVPSKKDSIGGEGVRGKPVVRLPRAKNSQGPSFNSYLTNPDQKIPEHSSSFYHPKEWLQTGLKKLGSMRRSPMRSPGSSAVTVAVNQEEVEEEGTDRAPGHSNLKQKRKDIIHGYRQDTVSLDSVSVSSQSEFSEYHTTETDETIDRNLSSPYGESLVTSGDFANSMLGEVDGSSVSSSVPIPGMELELDETLQGSYTTVDSGINLTESTGSSLPLNENNHVGKKVTENQFSGSVKEKSPRNRTDLFLTPEEDLDFERGLSSTLVDPGVQLKRQEVHVGQLYGRESDSNSNDMNTKDGNGGSMCHPHSAQQEDMSEQPIASSYSRVAIMGPVHGNTEAVSSSVERGEGSEGDLQCEVSSQNENGVPVATSYSRVAILGPVQNNGEVGNCHEEVKDGGGGRGRDEGGDEPPPSCTQLTPLAPAGTNGDQPAHSYANLHIPGGIFFGAPRLPQPGRQRSSSSPRGKKRKPKPLPRHRKALSVEEDIGGQTLREDNFLSSLPANFRPVPVPRRDTKSDIGTSDQREEGFAMSLPVRLEEVRERSEEPRFSPPPLPPPRMKRKRSHANTLPPIRSSFSTKDSGSSPDSSPLLPPSRMHLSSSSSDNVTTVHHSQDSSIGDRYPTQDGDSPKNTITSGSSSENNSPNDVISELASISDAVAESNDSGSRPAVSEPIKPIMRQRSLTHAPKAHSPPSSTSSCLTLPSSIRREGSTSGNSSMVAQCSRASSSSFYQRPFSMQSPYDVVSPFPFGDEKTNGLHSGVFTWSPRFQQKREKSPVPASTRYSLSASFPLGAIHSVKKIQSVVLRDLGIKLPEGLLILCRNFHSMKLHIHPHNTYDTDGLRELLERHFLVEKPIYQLFAFHYRSAIRLANPTFLDNRSLPNFFHLSEEMDRLGLQDSKLWSVMTLLDEHPDLCPSYPLRLIVPICTPHLDIIRGARFYREGRFPTVSWVHRENGAALLRAAATNTERGQASSSLQTDKALLHAICGCNQNAKGEAKLYIFTGKTESAHSFSVSAPDSMLATLTEEQVKTYYYHNCKFVSAVNPPTFKSVRHSFNKLQAMLENKLPDEDYLIALDTTRWLPRVSELLSTSSSVCRILVEEAAHVLVCYEAGWDRTTQIVSLAQLLLDPYYRTMDGFQVLIQKEWLWFGHPFHARHARQGKTKEDGPIFLQWVDCVWQIANLCPSAFEFNERFLTVLVEHSHSSLFGTFLMDCASERNQCFSEKKFAHMSVSTHTISFWTWVSMVNAAGRTFYNELYDPEAHPGVIYPRTAVPCLKLWTSHYCRFKAQENVTQPSTLQRQLQELVRLYKKLSVHSQDGSPSHVVTKAISTSPPPALGDENQEWTRHENPSPMVGRPGGKPKPHPPPKPSGNKSGRQYESIEQYLVEKGCDPSICKHIELSQTVCQGYLMKLGAVRKSWRRRWFVLDFNCQYLAYFQDQQVYAQQEAPKGVIHLKEIVKVFQSTKRREHLIKNIFTLETKNRTYFIQAPSIITMELWVACLRLPVSSLLVNPL